MWQPSVRCLLMRPTVLLCPKEVKRVGYRTRLKPEATFQGDLKADSLDLVEIIMAFEDEFGIQIPEDKAQGIKTLGDAIKHLQAHATK